MRRIRLLGRPVPSSDDLPLEKRQTRMFRWDLLRGASYGVYETVTITFALVVAIRYFEAPDAMKQWIPATLGLGFLLSPVSLALMRHLHRKVTHLMAGIWLTVAGGLGLSTLMTVDWAFVVVIGLTKMLGPQTANLQTQLYSSNYSARERGSRLSVAFLITALAGIVFGLHIGEGLDTELASWRTYFIATAVILALGALTFTRIPSPMATQLKVGNFRENLALPFQDRLFGTMLGAWMLMGLGNLMLIPLRVEYLANPTYGINASNETISFILVITVSAFRLLSTIFWGYAFDRLNLITVRCLLNALFMVSITCFFIGDQLWLITAGAALLGAAFGGGGVMWTLWVTKVAPPDRVSNYMSMHTFTTGLRMTLAPFLGYTALTMGNPQIAALTALSFIGVSTVLFIRLRPALARLEAERGDEGAS